MPTDQTLVIVGAGVAGAKAAEMLREDGFDGRLVLIGTEDERPYERPPLCKELAARNVLGHGQTFDRLSYFFSDQYDVGMEYSGRARTGGRVVAGVNARIPVDDQPKDDQ
jgi:hypothetical protein